MNRSSEYGFYLPQNTDPISVNDFNYNFDVIDDNMLSKNEQTLTAAQQEQVRENIGAASEEDLEKIGSYGNAVSGIYTTAVWEEGSWTNYWTAPEDGVYIAFAWFMLDSDNVSLNDRKHYRQLHLRGTSTRLMGINFGYYDATVNESPFMGRMLCMPIKALAGQTLYPYVHTDVAGMKYEYTIFCLRIS